MTIMVATHNEGKLKELQELLSPSGFSLQMFTEEIDETGVTYEENALLKARYAMEKTGVPALADDSGLEVDALGGAPGVYSARYAPPGQRRAKILENLRGQENRKARFVACIALCYPDGREIVAHGVCEGEIAEASRGDGGFGYDPIFLLPELGKTMAEIPQELKNKLSHRAKALQNLMEQIGTIK